MSVKTYYTDSGIITKDKSPVNFYLNGGRDQANVIVTGSVFGAAVPTAVGPRASITTDNLTYPLPLNQTGAAGNTNPSLNCQSFYGSEGGLGVAVFANGGAPATLRVQSNYTRTSGHVRFSTDDRLWRAKNIILTKNACIRIPYITFTISSATAQTINLNSQTIQGLASKSYGKNAVAFRVRRTVTRNGTNTDRIDLPTYTNSGIGTIFIVANILGHPLQIGISGGGVNFDDPKSSTLDTTLSTLTIPANAEIILTYRSSTIISVLHSLP